VGDDLSLRRSEVRVSWYAAESVMGDEGRGGDGRRRRDGVDDMMSEVYRSGPGKGIARSRNSSANN